MGVRRHNCAFGAILLLLLLFYSTASAMSLNRLFGRIAGPEGERVGGGTVWERVMLSGRRQGPGSSPPSCRSKCGRCSPCKAVHVSVQPGTFIPLEYYPEAWRCKCGNKFYLP